MLWLVKWLLKRKCKRKIITHYLKWIERTLAVKQVFVSSTLKCGPVIRKTGVRFNCRLVWLLNWYTHSYWVEVLKRDWKHSHALALSSFTFQLLPVLHERSVCAVFIVNTDVRANLPVCPLVWGFPGNHGIFRRAVVSLKNKSLTLLSKWLTIGGKLQPSK